ncbi:MAG: type II toxin-antitoxin system Phd/YefM family antitoxin [Rickettsiales bacterium]|nr:type II toxin-antitoxin system Phd/YefM family antitoxin [Rickettsiales bacterium]
MTSVNISEIKANLSYYINLAIQSGEPVTICSYNVPVAQITAIKSASRSRVKFGANNKKTSEENSYQNTVKEITKIIGKNSLSSKKPAKK